MTYQEEIWRKAVAEADSEVMRNCPTLAGGRKTNESAEQYADRCAQAIDVALKRLEMARRELAIASRAKATVKENT